MRSGPAAVSTVALMTRECSSVKPPMFFGHVAQGREAQDRDAVVGLLAEHGGLVAGRLQDLQRELVVAHLELLQAQHVDRVGGEPVEHVLQAGGEGVDVPGGDSHPLIVAGPMMGELSGDIAIDSADACALRHLLVDEAALPAKVRGSGSSALTVTAG